MRSLTIGKPEGDPTRYESRTAVRCVITNESEICIIYVKKGNYYKLPGGGVEDGEDESTAAIRECHEECGCEVNVESNLIAQTLEWRGTLKQTSNAYHCSVIKDTGIAALTEEEAAEGLKHEWCSVEEALRKMKEVEPTSGLGSFIKERDIFLLTSYLESA